MKGLLRWAAAAIGGWVLGTCVFAGVITADFDADGQIKLDDLGLLAGVWQTVDGQADFEEQFDLDRDGYVGIGDLAFFASQWLDEPALSFYEPLGSRRQRISFNLGWKFYKGEVAGDAAGNPSYDDSSWTSVRLPHNPPLNGQTGPDPLRPAWPTYSYEGVSWYRKRFTIDSGAQGGKVFLEFEGANTVTDVWINGAKLSTHYGGYLPFLYDLTEQVIYGGENVIAVKVDNTDNPDVPIGNADWFNWGGLYRDVWLHLTDKLYVTDAVYANTQAGGGIFVTYPSVSETSAQVRVKTEVKNEYGTPRTCTLKTFLVDRDNCVRAQAVSSQTIAAGAAFSFTQTMTVPSPHLWHPYSPYLYTLHTEVYDGSRPADSQQTRIGIRSISFSKAGGFRINGRPFRFRGANRLQDYPFVGYAMGNSGQRQDARKLKEAGFDYVRTSHYPQDPAFMDACDELGILVMNAIPGFQYVGGETFCNHSYQTMREMIRRDRNRPCVIAWELSLNETGFNWQYASNAVQIGHAEYPGSYVSGWLFDWAYDIFIATPTAGARTYGGSKPLVISEYGHWEYGGDGCASDVHRGNVNDKYAWGEAAMLAQAANHGDGYSQNLAMTSLCGDGLWVGIDYGPYPSGVFDIYRLPKFSYYFWKSQRDADLILDGVDSGPMVYIANYWQSSSPTAVTVYSNCERVRLYVNNVLRGEQGPDEGTNLPHPPFTFSGLTWTSGTLRAEGLIGGQVAAEHTVRTPAAGRSLSVRFDTTDVPADGSELVFVYASILDVNGTPAVTESNKTVTFSVSGPAELVSPASIRAEGGIAAGLIRVLETPGQITVTASGSGLTAGSASFSTQ
ncbi:MAG TPA: glycoside hydrolase family 2 TIM barrel-domain containing protein [Anaerohalosphaeraceae bacterium]|nr:glycoside hydrolase family 2 TIM barrel-domain containing protein [Anaerohalosphaeraceae bacterium]